MKNQTSIPYEGDYLPSSLKKTEKKRWHAPRITQLKVKDTKGGAIDCGFEGPWGWLCGNQRS